MDVFGLLGYVHGGVGGFQNAVPGGSVFGVERDAQAGGTTESMTICEERFSEAALKALGYFRDFGAASDSGEQHDKFVATDARQQVVGAQLPRHALGGFLKVDVADVVTKQVVDPLELVEVDVDQAKDGGVLARLLDKPFEILFKREAVVAVGEQIEFGTIKQVGVDAPGLDGQGGELGSDGERFTLIWKGRLLAVERRREYAQELAGVGEDLLLKDALGAVIRPGLAKRGCAGDVAATGSAVEGEGDKLRDVFDDLSEGTGFVDVLKNAAAALFQLRHATFQCGFDFAAGGEGQGLLVEFSIEDPMADSEGNED